MFENLTKKGCLELRFFLKPIPSMYGIFTYIYHRNQPNVGRYTNLMDPMGNILFEKRATSVFGFRSLSWNVSEAKSSFLVYNITYSPLWKQQRMYIWKKACAWIIKNYGDGFQSCLICRPLVWGECKKFQKQKIDKVCIWAKKRESIQEMIEGTDSNNPQLKQEMIFVTAFNSVWSNSTAIL